jgi:GTP 3',8-cyclase
MNILKDNYGRKFSYLRLSVTDACNFRCKYCLPNGYKPHAKCGDRLEDTILKIHEIENLVFAFAELGFRKVRLTGGEPTLRNDIVDIVKRVSDIPGINTVALTTNGYRLHKIANALKQAGLTAINISVDSLDSNRFLEITGSRHAERVYQGVQSAINAGIKKIKINSVLLKSFIDNDLDTFLAFVSRTPISLRFIELMETADSKDFFSREYISGDSFREQLEAQGWSEIERDEHDGPAREFVHHNYIGRLGIISPYSKDFCTSCNRLRVSSRGKLRLCLLVMVNFHFENCCKVRLKEKS